MKILKDSRQMPKRQEQVANKMYSDVVYAWLQVNSEWDKEANVRWVAKKDVKYVKIAECLGITRQTASTKFKKLLDKDDKGQTGMGLVVLNEDKGRYELLSLSADISMLIENGTLRKMLNALNENAISVYIYLLNRFLAEQERPFELKVEQVKQFIGISTSSRGNNYIVSDIMLVLKKLGLVEYEFVYEKAPGGEVRSSYRIVSMSNFIQGDVPERNAKC